MRKLYKVTAEIYISAENKEECLDIIENDICGGLDVVNIAEEHGAYEETHMFQTDENGIQNYELGGY